MTTRWSLVRGAGRGSGAEARAALEEMCRIYWYPLYAFVRRSGRSHEDARDLVQGFFASFLERESIGAIGEDGGRFRGYLLGALRHHIANELERSRALKRGGDVPCSPSSSKAPRSATGASRPEEHGGERHVSPVA